jgi:pentatricopeptide repeat domain-containing protein 1/leucine-rich PPR motif-containing protein
MNPTPSIVQFGKILTSLIKMKNYPTAIVTATSVTSIFPFNIMINCYCHVGHIILAKNFKLGFHPDTVTFSTLIEDLCLKGHIHKALHFHDQLIAQGFHLNQVSYGILINGLCKLGETRAAMQLLRQMEGTLHKPNVVMYNTIIDRMFKDKLLSDAKDLYSEMTIKGVSSDVVTYTSLIYGFCIVGQLKEAIGLLNEMVVSRKLNGDVYIISVLLDALCKEGNVKQASYDDETRCGTKCCYLYFINGWVLSN